MLNLYKTRIKPTILLAILFLVTLPAVSQKTIPLNSTEKVIYSESFQKEAFPSGWIHYTNTNYAWEVIKGAQSRGNGAGGSSLRLQKKGKGIETDLNIWAFTSGIKMTAGRVYTVSFYQKNLGGGGATFQLILNSVQNHTSTQNQQNIISTVFAPKSKFGGIESTQTFTVTTDGNYYLGFGVTQFTDNAELHIDDIRITESSGPMKGEYKIGEDADFVKPETAVFHLNKRGIDGPVTLNFIDADYTVDDNRNMVVNAFPAVGTAPVLFKANTPGTPAIISGNSDKGPLLHLNGVSNVHLDGINFSNEVAKTPWAILIENSNNCTVNACIATASAQVGNVEARGITVKGGANITLTNNMVHSILSKGSNFSGEDINLSSIYGIVMDGGSDHKLYNNTVAMTGQRNSSASVAAALAVAAGTTGLDIRNNILSNLQSSTATNSTNYAVYSLAGTDAYSNLNYNLYYVGSANTNFLGYMSGSGNAVNLANWKEFTLKDGSSMFGEPAFKSTTSTFSNPVDLTIDPANPRSWFTNGTGVQIATVTHDMIGSPRSTTVATGGVDLGALEFTPNAVAPDMVVSGALYPGPAHRQVYSFAERTIAIVSWSSTSQSFPNGFALKYRPGEFIKTYNGQVMNSWIQVINGTNSNYDLEMYYDEALLGRLQESPVDFTMGEHVPTYEWVSVSNDVEYDFVQNKLTRRSAASSSAFVGSDRSNSLMFYNKPGNANLSSLSTWAANADGSGVSPANFTNIGRTYYITNYEPNTLLKLNNNLTIGGAGSKVVLGNGTVPVTLPVYDKKSVIGGAIDMTANTTLLIDAPVWPNLGTLDQSSIIMLGANAPVDVSIDKELPNVVLIAGKKIKLKKSLKIKKKLELREGSKMELGDYSLNIDYDGQIVSNDGSSYIIPNGKGKLRQGIRAGQEVSLPVGTATTYNPVKIKLVEGSQDDIFSVGLINGVYEAYDANDVPTSNALITHNVNKTWLVSEDVKGGSNITLTLTWTLDEMQTAFDPNNCYVQHYENGAWDDYLFSAATANTVTGADGTTKTYYSISRPGITSFSPMGVRTSERISPLPVELVQFTANITHQNSVLLNWATASEENNEYIIIERSADGKNFSEIGRLNGAGTTNRRTNYTYTDNTPLTGISYYRLRQISHDGTAEFSATRSVKLKAAQKLVLSVYPNPSLGSSDINLLVQGLSQNENTVVRITDMAGRTVLKLPVKDNKTTLTTTNLRPGVYIINLISSSGTEMQKLVIK